MSWSVWVRRADHSPLGDREVVEQAISSAFPGVQFYREPSGPEKIAVMRARGVEFPEVLRRHLDQQPATQQGDFEGDGFSVRFFLGAKPVLGGLLVELRGETQGVIPCFQRLAAQAGWVIEEPDGEPLIR